MFDQKALVGEMSNLQRFALRLTRNASDAEDLVQATLLRALEKADYFEDGTNLFSWTSKIMFNIFVSHYRRRTKFETQYDPETFIERESVEASNETKVELAEVQGLSRLAFIRQIVVPGALPGFFVGLRLAVTGSWLGLVVLEQINATSGLGYMMFQAQNYGQSDVILVGLLVYGVFGLLSDFAVRLIERRVLSWRRTLSS